MPKNRGRNRLVLSFFVLGSVVPLALMIFGWIAGTSNAGGPSDGHTSIAQWAFLWVIWPTWILMLDAEHTGTIVFMLLLAAPLNGVWYAAVASVFWYTGVFLKWLATRLRGLLMMLFQPR
jgi:hypothetical protein